MNHPQMRLESMQIDFECTPNPEQTHIRFNFFNALLILVQSGGVRGGGGKAVSPSLFCRGGQVLDVFFCRVSVASTIHASAMLSSIDPSLDLITSRGSMHCRQVANIPRPHPWLPSSRNEPAILNSTPGLAKPTKEHLMISGTSKKMLEKQFKT